MFASVVLCDFQKAFHAGWSSPERVLKALGPREAAQLELWFTCITLLCMVDTVSECSDYVSKPMQLIRYSFCLCPM